MAGDVNDTLGGDHFSIYTNVELWCCTPETNVMSTSSNFFKTYASAVSALRPNTSCFDVLRMKEWHWACSNSFYLLERHCNRSVPTGSTHWGTGLRTLHSNQWNCYKTTRGLVSETGCLRSSKERRKQFYCPASWSLLNPHCWEIEEVLSQSQNQRFT